MSTNLVTLNGKEVPDEAPGKNVINIHITQESSLAYLFKAMGQCFARQQEATGKTAAVSGPPPKRCCYKGEQKVLGSIQILLGLVCIALGVLDQVLYPSSIYCYITAGAPFWMGGLYMLSGALSIVGERHGGRWVHLATFLHLGSIMAGIAALTCGILPCAIYFGYDNICERPRYESWVTLAPEDEWRTLECSYNLWDLVRMVLGVRILLLIFSITALLIAFVSFVFGLRLFCRSLQANNAAYDALEDVEVPPPYEVQARVEPGVACPTV